VVKVPRSYKHLALESDKVVSRTYLPLLPPLEILLVLISVRGCVDPGGNIAAGKIKLLKNPEGPFGN